MRRSVWLFAVLALCAVLLLGAAAAAVNAGKTEITVTEQTLYGDPAAVQGLVLETYQNRDRQLFWHTTCLAGEVPQVSTTFSYTMNPQRTPQTRDYSVDFSVGTGGFGASGSNLTPEDFDEMELMAAPAWDVASRTKAGETHTELVQLNQYYDYFTVSLTGSGLDFCTSTQMQEWTAFLTDYFRIPVPDQVQWEVTVGKDKQDRVTDIHCSECLVEGREGASAWADCVFIGTDLYLLVRGNLDVSGIKGGYGIYRIPGEIISEYQNVAIEPALALKVLSLENIYPLDPELCGRVSLAAGPEDGTLLLLRQLERQVRVRILDAETGTSRQELCYEAASLPEVWSCDALLILVTDREQIRVYCKEDDLYTLWMADRLYPLTDNSWYYVPELAFDGNRLAVAASTERYYAASSRVTVYEATGLAYAGDYHYSCDTLPGEDHLASYNWVEPFQLHWN